MLAFDFGTKRIGVATGQSLTQSVMPLATLQAKDGVPNWDEMAKLVETWQPDVFLVGLPLTMEGEVGDIVLRARKFAKRLHGRFHRPCYEMDERLSSFEAEQAVSAGKEKQDIDSLAASVILASWFRQPDSDLSLIS